MRPWVGPGYGMEKGLGGAGSRDGEVSGRVCMASGGNSPTVCRVSRRAFTIAWTGIMHCPHTHKPMGPDMPQGHINAIGLAGWDIAGFICIEAGASIEAEAERELAIRGQP